MLALAGSKALGTLPACSFTVSVGYALGGGRVPVPPLHLRLRIPLLTRTTPLPHTLTFHYPRSLNLQPLHPATPQDIPLPKPNINPQPHALSLPYRSFIQGGLLQLLDSTNLIPDTQPEQPENDSVRIGKTSTLTLALFLL